ncbi:MAG: N-6 DNA methylase, partial [Aquificae bacterium]|nr:N-6 DNA methylase [Aquificota bacterium]
MEGKDFREAVKLALEYREDIKKALSEAHKRELFVEFVRKLYSREQDIRIEDGVEFRGVYAGRVDLAIDGVLFEFKRDINSSSARKKALQELRKYLNSDQYRNAPFGIITDGVRFEVYERENLKKPVDVFSLPEEGDEESVKNFLYRLDRYLLAPFRVPLTSERVIDVFGYNSSFFRSVYRKLLELYKRVREEKDTRLKFGQWQVYMSFVYGRDLEKDLFFRHTYLSMVVKILGAKLLGLGESVDVIDILTGKLFERAGIRNYAEEDFYSWVFHPDIVEEVKEIGETMFYTLSSKFEIKDLEDELEEDILKELYQNIVTRAERRILGEYYTPDWLVQEILDEVLKDPKGKILDPACGSGSFLFFTIKRKKALDFKTHQEKLEHILDTVVGIDINPLAVLIAKTNYLIALGELLKEREKDVYIPVYSADSLLAFLEPSQKFLFGDTIKLNVDDITIELPKHEDTELIDRLIDL